MQIELLHEKGILIAEIKSEKVVFGNVSEALDIMANCGYQGAEAIIIQVENIGADFFNLKTGLAGEILQKFSNYKMKLAIVGDFSKYESKSLKDFIYESNKSKRINFVDSVEKAKEVLR